MEIIKGLYNGYLRFHKVLGFPKLAAAALEIPPFVKTAVVGDRYTGPHIYGNYHVLGSRRVSALDGEVEQLRLGWCKNQCQLRCRQDILKPRQLSNAKHSLLDAGTMKEPAMHGEDADPSCHSEQNSGPWTWWLVSGLIT